MTHLGPLLARSLVRNIGGHAARSELDKLCEPLKRLVTARVDAQGWLQQALLSPGSGGGEDASSAFPGAERVSPEERVVWLKKIIG